MKTLAEEVSELKQELAISKENEQILFRELNELDKEYKELLDDYRALRREVDDY